MRAVLGNLFLVLATAAALTCDDSSVVEVDGECECVDNSQILAPVDSSYYVCFTWDCTVTSEDAETQLYANTTLAVDADACTPAYGETAFTWNIFSPNATEVTDTQSSAEPELLDQYFDELGDWTVDVFACSSLQDVSESSCSETSFVVTVVSDCEPGQGLSQGVCYDCDPGYYGDGTDCIACGEDEFSLDEASSTCAVCPADTTTVTEAHDGCVCDDDTTVAVYGEADDVTCVAPTIAVEVLTAEVNGSVPATVPFSTTLSADVSVDVEDLDLATAWTCGGGCDISEEDDVATFDALGEWDLTLTVSVPDRDISVSDTVTIVLNDRPVVALEDAPTTSDSNVFTLSVSCADDVGDRCGDADAYAFALTPEAQSVEFDLESGVATITTDPDTVDDATNYAVVVVVTDAFGVEGSVSANVAVNAQTHSPVFTDVYRPTLSDWTADETNTLTFAIGVEDPDDEAEVITCAVTGDQVTGGADSCDAVEMTFDAVGTYSFSVVITDSSGLSTDGEFAVYVYADDLMAAQSVERPDDSASWTLSGLGAYVSAVTCSSDGECEAEQVDATDVVQATALDAFVGDVTVTVELDMEDHLRYLTGVLTTTPAVPVVTVSGDFVPADSANAAYLLVDSLPADVDVSASATIADESASVASVEVQLATHAGVVLGSATDAALTVSVDAAGEYELSATATSDQGAEGTDSENFYVLPVIALADPGLALTLPSGGGDVTATLEFDLDGSVYTEFAYAWTGGSDQEDDFTDEAPSVTFAEAGDYTWSLTVTALIANFGESPVSATATITVTVLPADESVVTASATAPASDDLTELTTSFVVDASASTSSLSADSLVFAWTASAPDVFAFDDASAAAPTVTVTTAGLEPSAVYEFTVVVTDSLTSTDTASVAVSFAFFPTLTLTGPAGTSLLSDGAFAVVAATTDPEGGDVSVEFTVTSPSGDVSTQSDDGEVAVAEAGTYSVSAVATDAQGLTASADAIDVVVYGTPEVWFNLDQVFVTRPGTPAEDLAASVTVTANSEDAVDDVLDWSWAITSEHDNETVALVADGASATLTTKVEDSFVVTVTAANAGGVSSVAQDLTITVLPTTDTRVFVSVVAAEPVTVFPTTETTLDGSATYSSASPDDAVEAGLVYEWTQLSGPATDLVLTGADEAVLTVSGLDVAGEYEFQLTCWDKNNRNDTGTGSVQFAYPPEISISADGNAFFAQSDDLPDSYEFVATVTSEGDSIDSWAWSLSDDCEGVAAVDGSTSDATLTLTSLARGRCEIELTVVADSGAPATVAALYQATTLVVSAPDSFTSWYQGFSYDVTWTAVGFSDDVEVFAYLVGYEDMVVTLSGGAVTDSDSFQYSVPVDYSGVEFNSDNGDTTFSLSMRVLDRSSQNEDSTTTADFLILPAYSFEASEWSECVPTANDCGAGFKTRTVSCVSPANGDAVVNNYFCKRYGAKPATSSACISDVTCSEPEWYSGDWSEDCVTASTDWAGACGAGTVERDVVCVNVNGSTASEAPCVALGLTKPDTTQYCSLGACATWAWKRKSTGPCSAECGGGTRGIRYGCRNQNTGYFTTSGVCTANDPGGKGPATEACNTDACPTYQWSYSAWSDCSEDCGSDGVKTRTAVCVDESDAEVADTNCEGSPTLSRGCNLFPCTYYWYTVGEWDAECTLPEGDTCGDGTRSREVLCASSAARNALSADLSECEASLGSAGYATELPCQVPCSFCDTTDCSGRGFCLSTACECDDGYSGTYCEVATGCAGVVDGTGACCASGVVSPNTDLCCASGAVGSDGECCAEGEAQLDACGACSAAPEDVSQDLYGDCCEADLFDAQSLCCPAASPPDICGVCGGSGVCATAASASSTSEVDGVDDCDALLADETALDLYYEGRQNVVAELLGITVAQVRVLAADCLDRRRRRRRLLGEVTVSTDYLLLPGDVSTDAFSVEAALAEGDITLSSSDPAGVCGNGVCQADEQCSEDGENAATCCLQDCPLVATDCAVPENGDGSPCGGHGSCLAASGACACFESIGYAGDACGECAVGFYATGSGADFGCAVQVSAVAVDDDDDGSGDDDGTTGGGGGDDDNDNALRVVAIVVPLFALSFVTFLVYAKKRGFCGIRKATRQQPLFHEQTIKSAELTTI